MGKLGYALGKGLQAAGVSIGAIEKDKEDKKQYEFTERREGPRFFAPDQ